MLKIGVLGIGNGGSQVARLAFEEAGIPAIAINSSEEDLNTVSTIPSLLIGDGQGSGKDRGESKRMLKSAVEKLIDNEYLSEFMNELEFVFIAATTGGGTGSGLAPLVTALIEKKFPNVKPVLIGIMPTYKEKLSAQDNTSEHYRELLNGLPDATYMVYDNNQFSHINSPSLLLEAVNRDIVEDLVILQGTYQYQTQYDSIDKKESSILLTTPGRLAVLKAFDIKEADLDNQTIDDLLLKNLSESATAEIDRNRDVNAWGVISNLSPALTEKFNYNMPGLTEIIGEPIEAFQHVYVTQDKSESNNVFVILGGLTAPNTRLQKVFDRTEEIVKKQEALDQRTNIFDDVDNSKARTLRTKQRAVVSEAEQDGDDLNDILNRF